MSKQKTHLHARGTAENEELGASSDIIKLILKDHQPLKKLIEVMKDDEAEFSDQKDAFDEFTPLLISHAKAEEESLYDFLIDQEEELRDDGYEGQVEHHLADQLIDEAKQSTSKDLLKARIKVLAEIVEHHIEEEEEEMLPEFKKNSVAEIRIELGKKYLELKKQYDAENSESASKIQANHQEEAQLLQ